jgi:hypothetical protein
MPEDRFGDLGRPDRPEPAEPESEGDERPVAERLHELDEAELAAEREAKEREGPPRSARPAATRYGWVVGVAFFIVIVVVLVNSAGNPGRGTQGPEAGTVLPDFAAPEALRGPDGDANVKQAGSEDSAGNRTPACEVRGRGIVNVCELRARRPVIVTFVGPAVPDCLPQLDAIERVARQVPQVAFVAVMSGKPRREVADLVRRRGWTFPVAVDRDPAIFNLYRVAFCPTTVLAERGGRVERTVVERHMSERELRAAARRLARQSRS